MSEHSIVGALEIGTAKIVVAVGEVVEGQGLNILGLGEVLSKGVKKGEIYDLKETMMGVHRAIIEAEKSAGVELESLYLGQTGSDLKGFFNEASVNVSGSDNRVKASDMNRVIQEAKGKELPEGRVYINHVQNPFRLDGRLLLNPLGMEGKKLDVGYWSVHADVNKLKDSIHIVNGFGLRVEDMIVSSVASGSIRVNEVEKKSGVIVVDIGCGTTDYVIFRDGCVICSGVIPVGGDHLTNDISLGLRVSAEQAEELKLEYARAQVEMLSEEPLVIRENDGVLGTRSVNKRAISQIVSLRVEELFKLIKDTVGQAVTLESLAGGAILTGGTSRLLGIERLGTEVLGITTRLGESPSWANNKLKDPEYSVVLGLLFYALKSTHAKSRESSKSGRLFNKVARIFTFH